MQHHRRNSSSTPDGHGIRANSDYETCPARFTSHSPPPEGEGDNASLRKFHPDGHGKVAAPDNEMRCPFPPPQPSPGGRGGKRTLCVFHVKAVCGFTLLELLVVMVIIGLLAGFVGPKYFAQVGKSEIKVARAQIVALEKSLDQYRLDTGHYPSMEQGLAALNSMPSNEPKWDGPYLKKAVPNDPWGHPYLYKIPGDHDEFDLYSYGKDGQPGGEGEAADIYN